MKICIPTMSEEGTAAKLSEHFGRACYHLVVDTHTGECSALKKPGGPEEACVPFQEILGRGVDVVLCKGIGRGAVDTFHRLDIPVMATSANTVQQAILDVTQRRLVHVSEAHLCAGHHPDRPHCALPATD